MTDPSSRAGSLYTKDTMRIIDAVGRNDSIRFHSLAEQLDIDAKKISFRLTELRDAGLVNRTFYDEMPPRVVYDLTDKGKSSYRTIKLLGLLEFEGIESGLEVDFVETFDSESWGMKARNYERFISNIVKVEKYEAEEGLGSMVQE